MSWYQGSPAALDLNRTSFNQILFRPRILVDVEEVDTRTEFLGHETSLPVRRRARARIDPHFRFDPADAQFFISPAGMAGLAHPLAERGLSRAAGEAGIIQMVRRLSGPPVSPLHANLRSG